MFVQMIFDHIPRSWKAATALLVIFISFTFALNTFTVLLTEGGGLWDWSKFILSMTIGVIAAAVFYIEQFQAEQVDSYEKVHVETLAQHHKDVTTTKKNNAQAWHMNDLTDETHENSRN